MLKRIFLSAILVFTISCNKAVKFPLSEVVPAATLTVKTTTDEHENYNIELEAENLAGPERVSPSAKYYTVWVKTKNDVQNVGNFTVKNGGTSAVTATTPFDFTEIFITAEKERSQRHPSGKEIARVSIAGK